MITMMPTMASKMMKTRGTTIDKQDASLQKISEQMPSIRFMEDRK